MLTTSATYPPIDTSSSTNGTTYNEHQPIVYVQQQQQEENWVIVGCMIGSLVVLVILFLVLVVPPLFYFIKSRIPVSPVRIERRYETIEAWLITKRVRNHDVLCQQILNEQQGIVENKMDINTDDETKIEAVRSVDTAETTLTTDESIQHEHGIDDIVVVVVDDDDRSKIGKTTIQAHANDGGIIRDICSCNDDKIDYECYLDECTECPICYECMDSDSIVSWSPNRVCDHVFHHECIKEWLLHHDTCPCCRVSFLLVDADAREYDAILKDLVGANTTTDDNTCMDITTKQGNVLTSSISPSFDDEEVQASTNNTSITNSINNNTNTRPNQQQQQNLQQEQKKEWIQPLPWTVDQLQCLAKYRSKRSRSTYFCNQHGLISITFANKNTKRKNTTRPTDIKNITNPNVQPNELIDLREKSRLTAPSDVDDDDQINDNPDNNNVGLVPIIASSSIITIVGSTENDSDDINQNRYDYKTTNSERNVDRYCNIEIISNNSAEHPSYLITPQTLSHCDSILFHPNNYLENRTNTCISSYD